MVFQKINQKDYIIILICVIKSAQIKLNFCNISYGENSSKPIGNRAGPFVPTHPIHPIPDIHRPLRARRASILSNTDIPKPNLQDIFFKLSTKYKDNSFGFMRTSNLFLFSPVIVT